MPKLDKSIKEAIEATIRREMDIEGPNSLEAVKLAVTLFQDFGQEHGFFVCPECPNAK